MKRIFYVKLFHRSIISLALDVQFSRQYLGYKSTSIYSGVMSIFRYMTLGSNPRLNFLRCSQFQIIVKEVVVENFAKRLKVE